VQFTSYPTGPGVEERSVGKKWQCRKSRRCSAVNTRVTLRDRLRSALESVALIVPTLALVAFVVGAVLWFIASAKSNGTIDTGGAFAGLGYMGAAVAVVLLAVLGARLLGLLTSRRAGGQGPRRPARPTDDRGIIRSQLAWGSGLVITGAIIGLVCLCFVHPSDLVEGPVLALATAVIGAGATLLPAGAASSAGTRIQQELNEVAGAPVVTTTTATRAGQDKAKVSGTVDPGASDVEAYFEYRHVDPDGEHGPIAQLRPGEQISARAAVQTVERDLVTLDGTRAYQVRLVAETPAGKRGEGRWLDFPEWAPETKTGDH
jgi:hypothetical protein